MDIMLLLVKLQYLMNFFNFTTVPSETFQICRAHLRGMPTVLQITVVILKLKDCSFLLETSSYLGHVMRY